MAEVAAEEDVAGVVVAEAAPVLEVAMFVTRRMAVAAVVEVRAAAAAEVRNEGELL